MLKMVLIVRMQQHHQKEIVVIEVHVMDVEEVEIEHIVSMVLRRRKVEKIDLKLQQQQQLLLINKITMDIKIIMHIIVCSDRFIHTRNKLYVFVL
jgi:hypothetical protein